MQAHKWTELSYIQVHIKFPIYDDVTLRQIGEVTYSSGMDDPPEKDLVTWWWTDTEEKMARVSAYDHGKWN